MTTAWPWRSPWSLERGLPTTASWSGSGLPPGSPTLFRDPISGAGARAPAPPRHPSGHRVPGRVPGRPDPHALPGGSARMSPRRIALGLAAAAAALYLGVALPAVSQLSAVRTELLELRREREARA